MEVNSPRTKCTFSLLQFQSSPLHALFWPEASQDSWDSTDKDPDCVSSRIWVDFPAQAGRHQQQGKWLLPLHEGEYHWISSSARSSCTYRQEAIWVGFFLSITIAPVTAIQKLSEYVENLKGLWKRSFLWAVLSSHPWRFSYDRKLNL